MLQTNANIFLFFIILLQIADHTHIFFLLPLRKLWLHMGRHNLPQGCSKLQHIQHTHSLVSPMEFHHMVSKIAEENVTDNLCVTVKYRC